MILGSHTAADTDDEVGILCADVLVLADDGERLLLSMLTDGTGIHHDEIGIGGIRDDLIAHLLGHAGDLLTIGFVLLATKGQDKALSLLPCFLGMGLVPSADAG